MTIEQQIRQDNPTTTDEQGNRVGTGNPYYEAKISEWVARYADANKPTLESARAGMSGLIGTLSPESRAKFATARAGIETLLNLGDIEAAYVALENQPTDTPEEDAVKQTLLGAMVQFLPTS